MAESEEIFQENMRDISESEISLPFRNIEEYDDKTSAIDVLIEEYINAYFDHPKRNSFISEIWINVSDYEKRYSLFDNVFWGSWLSADIWNIVKKTLWESSIDIDTIFWAAIKNWVLFLYYWEKSAAKSIKIDLSRETIGKLVIEDITKTEIDSLEKNELETEEISLFWWVLATISYKVLKSWVKIIRQIELTQTGVDTIKIQWHFSLISGNPNTELLRVLESQGIELTPERKFIDTRNRTVIQLNKIEAHIRGIKRTKLIDTLKLSGMDSTEIEQMSDETFEKRKSDLWDMFRDLRKKHGVKIPKEVFFSEILKVPKYGKLIGMSGLFFIWLDTISDAFARPDDIWSYVNSIATLGAFSIGAYGWSKTVDFLQGLKLWRKIPTWPWKLIGGLVLGLGTAIWGHYVAQKYFDAHNAFTRAVPEREDWFQKYGFDTDFESSRILNTVWGWIFYTAVDGYERIPLFSWKYIDWRDGIDTFLYNSSIDAASDPVEYMNMTHTRDIEQWNRRVEIYREKTLKSVMELINTYRTKKEHSQETKNEFIASLHTLLWEPEGAMRYNNLRVFDRILWYFMCNDLQWYSEIIENKEVSMDEIISLFSHELWKLKIDEEYKKSFETDLGFEQSVVEASLSGNTDGVDFADMDRVMSRWVESQGYIHYNDLKIFAHLPEDKRAFLTRIYERTLKREKILEEGYYTDTNGKIISKSEGDSYLYALWAAQWIMAENQIISLAYHPSEDEQMWKYFTGWIDTDPVASEMISKMLIDLEINQEVTEGGYYDRKTREFIVPASEESEIWSEMHPDQEYIPESGENNIKPSQIFFTFFDRIVEIKRSQVFLENIQKWNSGRKWESWFQ